MIGETLNQAPPARPWVVLSYKRTHSGFWVDILNHHFVPPRPCTWHVPELDPERYDMTEAVPVF
jgi:hypothetical protein